MTEEIDPTNEELLEYLSLVVSVMAFTSILYSIVYCHFKLKINFEKTAKLIVTLLLLSFLSMIINQSTYQMLRRNGNLKDDKVVMII